VALRIVGSVVFLSLPLTNISI